MFSFFKNKPFVKRAAFLAFALVLSAGLMLVSCDNGGGGGSGGGNLSLVGTWVYNYGSGEDKYIITDNSLEYVGGFKGAIRHLEYFTPTAGVIIIEYDANGKQEYWDYSNWPAIDGPYPPLGDFYGIYFINLSSTSVQLANAADNGGDPYYRCEAANLNDAKAKFTAGNVGDFVDWSFVQPQVKQN